MLSHWLLASVVSAVKSDFNINGVPLQVMSHFFLAPVKIFFLSLAFNIFTMIFLFIDTFTSILLRVSCTS